jgi:dihydroorotate dehydrogenase electron transfer subunit
MMYRVVKIEKIKEETPTIKTFFFHDEIEPEPGQFYMIWLPSIDEFPMSISYIGEIKAFTVKRIGKGTNAMHQLKEGDKIWIRGPYGKGFEIHDGYALIIGGGSGMATLAPLIEKVKGDIIIAAKTKDELLFVDRFKDRNIYIATDDGTAGFKGFATELAKEIMKEGKYDIIYTCGPEIMIRKIVDLALNRGIKIQASLERLMKCGIGICDSCSINGYRVCVDGPVFSEKELRNMKDLGKYKRDASGRRVPV